MNEVVKYNNQLNRFNFGKFRPLEANLFFSLVSKFNNTQSLEIKMSFEELNQLSSYKNNSYHFMKDVESVYNKFYSLSYRIEDEDHIKITHIFDYFEIDKREELITLAIKPEMKDYLIGLTEKFTRFELSDFTSIKGAYAKSIYRLLKQWRFIGILELDFDDFKEILDIPKSYKQGQIDQKILKPAIEELSPFFEKLEYKKIAPPVYGKKGRPKVTGIRFTFVPEQKEKQLLPQLDPSQEEIAEVTGWEKTGRFCPKCRRPIYKKQLENENGRYYLYGHTDFKTGECDYSTYDYSHLIQEYQIQEEQMEVNEEGKSKLAGMIKNLFK